MKYLYVLFVSILLTYANIGTISANETPVFPTCSNPYGNIKITYNEGIHGVVGDTTTYTGSDIVFDLLDGNYMQCLCTTQGNGIQTDWWNVGQLERSEIESLIQNGWILVADGSVWGLAEGQYLAKNTSYSCSSGGTGGPTTSTQGGGSSGSVTSQAVSTSSGTGGAVLGLADAGGLQYVYVLVILGFGFLVLGRISNRAKN